MLQYADMGTRIITGRLHHDLEGTLFEHIALRKAEDPLSPVHVLVGSNLLGIYLRKRLALRTGGHINVRFLTFADMIRLFDDPDRLSLPAFAERAIVEELVSDGGLPPAFESVSGSAGFGDALLATFTDLIEGGCGAATAEGIAGGALGSGLFGQRTKDLFALYIRYLDSLEEAGGSTHERFARVNSRIRREEGSKGIHGPVLAYGFYDFNGLQLGLLESLGSAVGVTLFIPWTGGEADRFLEPSLRRFERLGCGIEHAATSGRPSPAVELFNAPGEEEEARALVRRLIEVAGAEDARFGRMGLLLPSKEIYLPLVAEALGEAGIPFYCVDGREGPEQAARKGVELLAELVSKEMERGLLVDFLASAPLAPVEGVVDPYGLWTMKSAESGMTGEGGWSVENAALRERIARGKSAGEENLGTLMAVDAVQRIFETIEGIRGTVAKRDSWNGFSALLSGAVRDLFLSDGAVDETIRAIECLGDLDRFTGPVTFESYRRILLARLSRTGASAGRLMGEGINVLSLGEARGLSFEHVFIPGLAERVFPSLPRQDPLLPDRERREIIRLAQGGVFLSERGRRLEEEALIFSLALDSAARGVVCSYPRMDQETGRERIESSFLRYIEGYSPLGGGTEPRRLHRFGRSGDEPLGMAEYDFLRTVRGEPVQPRGCFFERAVRMERARTGSKTLTPYEGVFSSGGALDALRLRLEERGRSISPTSLERYAACPFAYFLSNVLGIEAVDEPEHLIRITPLARGSIIHGILALLFERFRRENMFPLALPGDSRVSEITDEVIEAYLADYEEREPIGTKPFWKIERRFMREAVERYIEDEAGESSDYTPEFFERGFGYDDNSVSIEIESGSLSFHGRIDRIDVGSGPRFRVIDYKTGKLSDRDQDLAGGTRLQLPVYLLAASVLLGRPVTDGEALYRRVGVGEGKRATKFSGARWEESEQEFRETVGTIVECIEKGFFPAVSRSLCDYCGVRSACLTDARKSFDRKAPVDARCREYLDMRGETS
jgi:ATP-dependent helicase/nuclease subunit B